MQRLHKLMSTLSNLKASARKHEMFLQPGLYRPLGFLPAMGKIGTKLPSPMKFERDETMLIRDNQRTNIAHKLLFDSFHGLSPFYYLTWVMESNQEKFVDDLPQFKGSIFLKNARGVKIFSPERGLMLSIFDEPHRATTIAHAYKNLGDNLPVRGLVDYGRGVRTRRNFHWRAFSISIKG